MGGSERPWRQPLFWLVVAIPVVAVAASAILIVSALRSSGNNDVVAQPVQRTAQIQVADLTPDARAHELGLSAVLRLTATSIEVLPATGTFDTRAPLRLFLQHPTEAARDQRLTLQPGPYGWRTDATVARGNAWRVEVTPADGRWRVIGNLPAGQQAVRVAPALGGR